MLGRSKEVVKDALLMTGLFFLLLVFIFIPLLGLIALWLLPLPFLMLTAKHRWSVVAPLVLLFGLLVYISPLFALGLPLLLFISIIGLTMGHLYRQEQSTGTDVVSGGLVSGFIGSWIAIGVGQALFHLVDQIVSFWQQIMRGTEQILHKAGINPTESLFPPGETLVLPFLFLITVPMVLLTYWIANKWLMRRGFEDKSLPPFWSWRLPRSFFYFFGLAFIFLAFVGEEETNSIINLMIGAMQVLLMLFAIQGCSFIAFFLRQKQKSMAWLIFALVLIFTPFSILVQLLGIVDTGFNLRERLSTTDKE